MLKKKLTLNSYCFVFCSFFATHTFAQIQLEKTVKLVNNTTSFSLLSLPDIVGRVCQAPKLYIQARESKDDTEQNAKSNNCKHDLTMIPPEVRTPTKEEVDKLENLYAESVTNQRAHRYESAELTLKRALELKRITYGEDHPEFGITLSYIASTLWERGYFVDAEALLLRALDIYERKLEHDHTQTLFTLNGLAFVLSGQGRYSDAERIQRRLLELSERLSGPKHSVTAYLLNALARTLTAQGLYKEAESFLLRVLEIRESSLDSKYQDIAQILHNLGINLYLQFRYDEAEVFHRRALVLRERVLGPNHPDVALSLNGLAVILKKQSLHASAESLHRRALSIRERVLGVNHLDTSESLNNLASTLGAQNRHAEAELHIRRAIEIRESVLGPHHFDLGTSFNNLAGNLRNQHRLDEAAKFLYNSISITEKILGLDHPETILSVENLTLLLLELNRPQDALAMARRAVDARRSFVGREARLGDEDSRERFGALTENAAIYLIRGAFETALLNKGDEQTQTLLRAEAFEAAQFVFESAASNALARGAARVAAGVEGLDVIVRDWEQAIEKLVNLDKKFIKTVENITSNSFAMRSNLYELRIKINQEIADNEAALRTRFPKFFNFINPSTISFTSLQATSGDGAKNLRSDEALVLIMPSNTKSYGLIFVVTKDSSAWAKLSLSPDQLNADISRLRETLDPGTSARAPDTGAPPTDGSPRVYDRATAKALYDTLFGAPQIAALIQSKPKWIIAPQGPLLKLPFAALVTRDFDGAHSNPDALRRTSWLGLERSLSIIPSVSSLRTLRLTPKPDSTDDRQPFFGLGDPAFMGPSACGWDRVGLGDMRSYFRGGVADVNAVRALSRLCKTKEEIIALADSFKVGPESYLLGQEATEAALRERFRDAKFRRARVIAFATHGLVAGDLDGVLAEPALALTPPPGSEAKAENDGLLTASEAARLDLAAEWMILSACDTAAGGEKAAEGLTGLARAFFYAGAQSLLVSHWRVQDDAAARITTRAVALATENPQMGRPEALRQAMRELMEDTSRDAAGNSFAHPAAWAPFFLVGVQ